MGQGGVWRGGSSRVFGPRSWLLGSNLREGEGEEEKVSKAPSLVCSEIGTYFFKKPSYISDVVELALG